MAASEHTPNMQLSQFEPDDRPSWLDDYNKDMRIIDTALGQSVGSAGTVGQTAKFFSATTVTNPNDDETLSLGFKRLQSMATRNAKESTDIPWTWDYTGDTVKLVFADHGVYRITVEAYVAYAQSLNVSSAFIDMTVYDRHVIPLTYTDISSYNNYHANGSVVIPYRGEGDDEGIMLATIFNSSTVTDAPIRCNLTIDIEQLSSQFSKQ